MCADWTLQNELCAVLHAVLAAKSPAARFSGCLGRAHKCSLHTHAASCAATVLTVKLRVNNSSDVYQWRLTQHCQNYCTAVSQVMGMHMCICASCLLSVCASVHLCTLPCVNLCIGAQLAHIESRQGTQMDRCTNGKQAGCTDAQMESRQDAQIHSRQDAQTHSRQDVQMHIWLGLTCAPCASLLLSAYDHVRHLPGQRPCGPSSSSHQDQGCHLLLSLAFLSCPLCNAPVLL